MEFGKLNTISGIDFTLPPDNPITKLVLGNYKPQKPQIFVGPPVWSNKDWVGKVYPTSAKEKDYLFHYARQFNTIELNVTHYQIPSQSTIERWKESVSGTDFKFCPKWPQIISHDAQLQRCEGQINEFIENVSALDNHLGTTFLQLAPYFASQQLPVLEKFLEQLPKGFPIAVEFRHQDWFSNEKTWQKTLEVLQKYQVGTVITDVAGRRDVLHQSLTTPTFTLRFVGNELHKTDYERVDAWVQKIKNWLDEGLQTAYIFVHCGGNRLAPELTKYWIEQLNKQVDLSIIPPKFLPKVVQGTLF